MSIEINIDKFTDYPKVNKLLKDIMDENKSLQKKVSYLESVLSEIQILNSLGKTLKINEAIQAAIQE
jgi:hypothetical protein